MSNKSPAAQENGSKQLLISVCYSREELPVHFLLMSMEKMEKDKRAEGESKREREERDDAAEERMRRGGHEQ